MKEVYKLNSRDGTKNSLKMLFRKDGEESKTFIIKTSASTLRTGELNDGSSFIDLSGGPMIVVGKPLEDADNAVVRSIDFTEKLGFTITFV